MKQVLNKTAYTKDPENKRLIVEREFAAGIDRVWRAWTDSKLLDQWWAPKPWKTETKSLDFRVGGSWLYSMNGPEGERHWAGADFRSITKTSGYEMEEYFCDENGKRDESVAPAMNWTVSFAEAGSATQVKVVITFASAEALQQMAEMGFQEGFAAAHDNLDEVLAT
jgi:uncharacterized protein YndB with AHSA1/START domain